MNDNQRKAALRNELRDQEHRLASTQFHKAATAPGGPEESANSHRQWCALETETQAKIDELRKELGIADLGPEGVAAALAKLEELKQDYYAKQRHCADLHERAESSGGRPRSRGARRAAATRAAKVALRASHAYEQERDRLKAAGVLVEKV